MKKSIFLSFFLMFCSMMIMAQDQGTLTMAITDVSSDNEQMAAGLEMMKGTELKVTYDGKRSMTKMNMMGGMVKTDIKMSEEGNMDMYMDMMGQKMWIPATKAEMEKAQAESGADQEFDYQYDENDTKEIAGFNCYKMTMTTPANPEFTLTAYVTEDIDINAAVIQNVDITKFKGFPLEYTMDMGMMKMTFSTTEFSKEADLSVFEVDTKGYKKMTMEEFQAQMGAMGGGGFGF